MKLFQTAIVLILILTSINQSMADSEQSNISLDTLTVTANKVEENVQDVPMGITVFSEQDIEDRNIGSVLDIADFVPNLTVFDNGVRGAYSPSTRGIHAFSESKTVSTGLYVDGVPVLSTAGYDDPLMDIERVEVLRGPQGTLYGKNTEAGVINIITRQPDNLFRGKIFVEGGEDEKKQGGFNISGPVMQDKLFFGLAGTYYDKEGFIKNRLTGDTVDGRRHWYGKGQLRWTPVDDLDVSLIITHLKYDDGVNNMGMTKDGSAMFGLPPFNNREIATDIGYNKSEAHSQSLKVDYFLADTMKLTSITTNRVYDDVRCNDYDYTASKNIMKGISDSQYKKLSQELRLSSTTEKLTWLMGLYYDRDDNDIHIRLDSDIPTTRVNSDRNFKGDAYAVFGQASYFFGEKLSVTAGLRYEKQEMDFTDHIAGIQNNATWGEVSPKITLDYLITPEIMAYAGVSKGYRSGGFNTYAANPQYQSYEEEKLWSYEAGIKSTLLNQRLIINAALFYMDIKDMQVNQVFLPEAYITNAAKSSALGGEVDITAKLTESLSLNASLGYTNIEFDTYKDALGDYKGNTPPYAPEYTFNIGAQYRTPQGFYARCDVLGYGKTYLDSNNEYSRAPYQIVNAKIGYEMEHFGFYLYGKNIFDKEYDSVGIFGMHTIYSDPREIGINLTWRF